MNSSIIRYILGYVLKMEAALMLFPCLVALIYREAVGGYYLLVAAGCMALGELMSLRKPQNHVFYLKEGCVTTALSWIALSFFGAIPFWLSGEIPSFIDAMFEMLAGFTATGSTILTNVEGLSHCALFWRSFTNWIGGMGVLIFLLAVIPLSGGSHINLMRAESPGPSVGKLVPKIKYTARILYLIYFAMTIAQIALLLIGRMPVFDAVAISFGTAGTGGFAVRNSSLAGYTTYQQWVVAVFMILFGVNFNAYYLILFRKFKKAFQMEEVRVYFAIIAVATAIITGNLLAQRVELADALRHAVFAVGSIISTTAYTTVNFDMWSQTCRTILVMLMFVGSCAGSTGGGIKVSRLIILAKTMIKELNSYIHPKSVKKIKMDDKPVEHEVVRSINVFSITFLLLFAVSLFAISFEGYDLVTTFTTVIAMLNNVGVGLAQVGPNCNYSFFSDFSKVVMMFDMLAGRLEIFPLLILFHPSVWRELFAQKRNTRKRQQNP